MATLLDNSPQSIHVDVDFLDQQFAKSSNRPDFRVVRAGNLDDPSSIQPSMNIWAASAPGWACLDPALEREERQPMPPK